MSLIEILPGVVKELIKYVPELAFEITDWDSVKKDLPVLASRLFLGTGVKELSRAQAGQIGLYVTFTHRSFTSASARGNRDFGDGVLRYYFAQLYCREGVFLDLRPSHSGMEGDRFAFKPNHLWYHFSDSFRKGILTLYDGFYEGDDSIFEAGLEATGLLDRSWPTEDQVEIKNLFRSHFGSSLERPMEFRIRQFQETFMRIFQFLIRKKVRLSSEFMLFGIYLVTLYLALEAAGSEHEVKKLYLEVKHTLTEVKK